MSGEQQPGVPPLSVEEWGTTDALWRMLHQALATGTFTARKQIMFGVASCWYCCDALPTEYYPVLNALGRFADRASLPTLRPGEMLFNRCFPWPVELEATALVAEHRDIEKTASAIMQQRIASLIPPGEIYFEGYPGFEPDERVFYAILGHVFAAAHGDGKGSIAQSRPEADLLRDIFGNPFRPTSFSLDWRTDTTVSLAQQMYDARDFGAMPILADALQDAGCDNEHILSHCRDGNRPHVRGCWVVDLVLGKE